MLKVNLYAMLSALVLGVAFIPVFFNLVIVGGMPERLAKDMPVVMGVCFLAFLAMFGSLHGLMAYSWSLMRKSRLDFIRGLREGTIIQVYDTLEHGVFYEKV